MVTFQLYSRKKHGKVRKEFHETLDLDVEQKLLVYFNLELLEEDERDVWFPKADIVKISLSEHVTSDFKELPAKESVYYLVESEREWTFNYMMNGQFVRVSSSFLTPFQEWVQQEAIGAWEEDNLPKYLGADPKMDTMLP